jgi:glycosyltransferase involved in cell wall biosynthesis
MTNNFRPGVVIPVGAGRLENLAAVLNCLHAQTRKPEAIVIVADGPEAASAISGDMEIPAIQVVIPKHEPGAEQPRNVGVRKLAEFFSDLNAVWFVDSDVLFADDALAQLAVTWEAVDEGRVIMAPYDWLPEGPRTIRPDIRNDPRWAMLNEDRWRYSESSTSRGELNVGLGCFSGNLVWPIDEFVRIGGFWNEIHHGRCEDGELGLRAVAHGIPITACAGARGYHLWHPVNYELATQRNARDVPMLNARHPWVQNQGITVVEEDGRRFNQRCDRCGAVINTLEWWSHRAECKG